MHKLLIALLFFAAACAAPASVAEIQLDFDRSRFGSSTLPIWSELSTFENWALSRMPAARAGDPDALLALYLLASGESFSLEDYDRTREEIDLWIDTLPLSGDSDHARRDARRLFAGMHTRFLGTDLSSTSMPEKYREEQSQLSGIFVSGEFNCISSSLLYVVAARKLGLDVDGVVLPSHAFVQLSLPDRVVDIETTSFNGFDIPHDEAFYSADAGGWFSERQLDPPTWDQYQQREILSPYDLGLFNMINQHTMEDRMAYRDRMRLAELRSHFQPWEETAQKSRLAYYYQEFVHLHEIGDYDTARRMYERVGVYLETMEQEQFQDPEIPVLLTAVQAQMADTLARSGEESEGLALARRLIQTRDFPETARTVESHLFSVISSYAVDLAERADYPAARQAFTSLEFQCLQNKVCNSGLAQVYSAWAMHYVQDRDWERSADVYREYLLLDSKSKLSQYFSENLERVYLNWAAAEEWNGEWETAIVVLNQCRQQLHTADQCETALEELDAKVKAGYL